MFYAVVLNIFIKLPYFNVRYTFTTVYRIKYKYGKYRTPGNTD